MHALREYWRDGVAALTVLICLMLASGGGGRGLLGIAGGGGASGGLPFTAGRAEMTEERVESPPRTAPPAASKDQAKTQTTAREARPNVEKKPAPEVMNLSPDDQSSSAETPVESHPTPVKQMNPEEVAGKVDEYRQYMRKGEIVITLGCGKVTSAQMASVIGLYLLKRDGTKDVVAVKPDGTGDRLEALPPGRLMAELPASKWPASLAKVGTDWLGSVDDCQAYFLLRLEYELQVYRLVAARSPQRGSAVRLELRPSSAGIEVAVIDTAAVRKTNR